jgi:hypothetical protein
LSSPLNIAARGLLEQIIEKAVVDIPITVKLYRMEQVKKTWQYKNPEDFILGYILGGIIHSFESIFKIANGRGFTPGKLMETIQTVYKRMPEIREAYSKQDNICAACITTMVKKGQQRV